MLTPGVRAPRTFQPVSITDRMLFIAGAQRHGLEDDNQERQSHGQLRKDVVKRDGERELKAVDR